MTVEIPDVQVRNGFVDAIRSKLTAAVSVVRYQHPDVFKSAKEELAPILAEAAAKAVYDMRLDSADQIRYSDNAADWQKAIQNALTQAWEEILVEYLPNHRKLAGRLASSWAANFSGFLSRELDPYVLN